MPARGISVQSVSGGSWLPWHQVIELEAGSVSNYLTSFFVPSKSNITSQGQLWQLFVNAKAKDLLYNDFSAHEAQTIFDSLMPCSYEAFTTGVDFAVPDVTIPKTFIVCEKHALFPPEHQKSLVAACGSDLKEVSVSGEHSAFASVPEELAGVLAQLIEG